VVRGQARQVVGGRRRTVGMVVTSRRMSSPPSFIRVSAMYAIHVNSGKAAGGAGVEDDNEAGRG